MLRVVKTFKWFRIFYFFQLVVLSHVNLHSTSPWLNRPEVVLKQRKTQMNKS